MAESIEMKNAETVQELRRQKKALRGEVLSRRNGLSEAVQKEAEKTLTDLMLAHIWYQEAEIVLGFASYGSEIRTDAVLLKVLQDGKQLYLPKVSGNEMMFYSVRDLKELQTGYRGIREPSEHAEQFVYDVLSDRRMLMLMPGVAFDAGHRRMGYGKGFYDRFLANKPILVSRTIGVAHVCQLVENVPSEDTDICPAQVICV